MILGSPRTTVAVVSLSSALTWGWMPESAHVAYLCIGKCSPRCLRTFGSHSQRPCFSWPHLHGRWQTMSTSRFVAIVWLTASRDGHCTHVLFQQWVWWCARGPAIRDAAIKTRCSFRWKFHHQLWLQLHLLGWWQRVWFGLHVLVHGTCNTYIKAIAMLVVSGPVSLGSNVCKWRKGQNAQRVCVCVSVSEWCGPACGNENNLHCAKFKFITLTNIMTVWVCACLGYLLYTTPSLLFLVPVCYVAILPFCRTKQHIRMHNF